MAGLQQQLTAYQEKYTALSAIQQKQRSEYDALLEKSLTQQAQLKSAQETCARLAGLPDTVKALEARVAQLQRENETIKQSYAGHLASLQGELKAQQGRYTSMLSDKQKMLEEREADFEKRRQAMKAMYDVSFVFDSAFGQSSSSRVGLSERKL